MARKPRTKDTGMGSFFGTYLFEQIVPPDHFMRAVKELFDWDALGHELIRLYEGKGLVGRPPYDPTLMFKMLFLSFLYDLSERDTQRFVDENIPARYFLDLALDQSAPDHSTLSIFKKRLLGNGTWAHLQRIYDGLLLQAMDHGLEFGHVQIVDATHTRDDVNHQKEKKRQEKGKPPRDPDSRVVDKGRRDAVEADGKTVKKRIRHRGYKTHTSVNGKAGVASSLLPSYGNMADNRAFAYLHAHDQFLGLPTTIYAGDKAYDDTDIFERIEQAGMHVGISLRQFRTAKTDANKERWERLKETAEYQEGKALRYRVEQPYGQAKDKHGLERCRYLGLLKYGVQSYLTFMAVTVKRFVKLLTGITFRELAKGRRREVFEPVYDTLPWL